MDEIIKPGLEGVVAFETTIAEPDKEGSALRYRGVDIEELVGHYPFEKVWGLLVDETFEPGMPHAEHIELQDPSGSVLRKTRDAARVSVAPGWIVCAGTVGVKSSYGPLAGVAPGGREVIVMICTAMGLALVFW